MTPRPAFARDMEAAARVQLGNALSQHLDAEACITFATASLGREHEALVRQVWADMGKNYMGVG